MRAVSGEKRKGANFGPKVKFGKMKTKVCIVCFFNSSFINRARALIFELHEGSIYSFVKFKFQSMSTKIVEVLKKKWAKGAMK